MSACITLSSNTCDQVPASALSGAVGIMPEPRTALPNATLEAEREAIQRAINAALARMGKNKPVKKDW